MRAPARHPKPALPPARVPAAWSAAVGAVFGALYLVLAPPVTGPKDCSEFTLVLAFGGAAHPTGYPLFVILGRVFVTALHALGATWAYAANAWSAVGGGVAMGLYHALAARLVPPGARPGRFGRFALALVPAALFGINPVWTLDAILVEVYTWHLAWVCGTCLFAVATVRAFAARGSPWDARRLAATAVGWGLLCGLGMAHHATAALVILALTVTLAIAGARAGVTRPWVLALAVGAALVPLTSYAFVAWRAFHPALFQWPTLEPSWRSVVVHLLGESYRDLLGHFAPTAVQAALLRAWAYPVLFPALLALIVAVARARGTERTILGGVLAAAALQTLYAFNYGVLDPSSYFQPAMAAGLLAIPAFGARIAASRRAAPIAALIAGVIVAVLGAQELRVTDGTRIGTLIVDRRARALWASLPRGPCVVFWRHDLAMKLRTYQLLEGSRPDVYVQNPDALTWRLPRREFEQRFGFDPLGGLAPLTAAKVATIPANVNRQTRLPVVVFDLEGSTLHLLEKVGSP